MTTKNIIVVGGGQMGGGIAQVAAQAGFHTTLVDISREQLDKSIGLIGKLLEKDVAKGKKTAEQAQTTLANLHSSTELDVAANADYVIEAVSESADLKRKIFSTLDAKAPAHAILGSNTSSIPITEIAAATRRPEQVIGIHFMNPVPVMKLVEIVRGLSTSEQTLATTQQVCKAMEKETIVVNKDHAGFILNRICIPLINEACWLLYEGFGSVEDIDKGVRLGLNHPMGPLTLADFIGLDTCLSILDVLFDCYRDTKYRACPVLRQMVQAGHYGKKSGRGFYEYGS